VTSIRDRLQRALSDALRSRDQVRTSVLRTTLSAIANAEAVEVPAGTTATELPRRDLTEDDVRAVVTAERAELESAAAELRAHDRPDAASELDAKAAVLVEVLAELPS
jgi:uncharacterized protein YqeY